MTRINIIGVLEDGAPRDPLLPRNTSTTIFVPQFEDVELNVPVFSSAGAMVDLTAGVPNVPVGTFTLRRQLDPCQRIPELHVSGAWAGAPEAKHLLRFELRPRDTRNLDLGRWFFDVHLELLTGPFTGRWQIVRVGTLVLQAALQRA